MEEFSWSYAIGTLFIRFFGIFLVLGLLMLGMIASGKIFAAMDRRANKRDGAGKIDRPAEPETVDVPAEQVAAAAVALHLHRRRWGGACVTAENKRNAWAEQGRAALMAGLSGASHWQRGR